MTDSYTLKPGTAPLLISMPHAGTELPAELAGRMTPRALPVADTGWHLGQLYDFTESLDASAFML